ncbi:methylmalonyl-CoA carboxyltransferase [Heliobacterium gestii]|uniref:Methylmalonyl-CoA carboxyltransferase n=1 Tax=Heliomicrobium gestii TaxID=2699 RepID=A0A845L8E3_HELGE|nr:carboxyl transferase domain-containing protein [Heliomicrobium gestii]MBM7865216.1 propionyl-CoA carboxylase beta chain [Heliomicrobium gestii]MZP41484.1 methylmalonyl-CoA carboxyltransferase [Heliomicrobium gestii]
MNMEERLAQLAKYREKLTQGGGPKRIAKQHESGKMTARERIEALLDPGSFVELGVFVGDSNFDTLENPGEGVVVGHGTVEGRVVYIYAQDFTVSGGSLSKAHADKIVKVMDLALKNGAPCLGLNDSGGARIQQGVDALEGYGSIFYRNTLSSGVIPQISAILGPCAGGAVYSPALTDFIFMVNGISRMFITGPQVIKAVTGEDVSPETLGGALTHNQRSGVAHFMADSELECFEQIRALLSYLPSNNMEEPPVVDPVEPEFDAEELLSIIPPNPNQGYDVRDVLLRIVDAGSFFEVQPLFAPNGITAFGRLNGKVVGILANQPKVLAGCLDIDVSDKLARFVRFCNAFNIPLLTFEDVPGFLPGTNQEYGGIIRHGAKMLYAYSEASVPKITIILRKAYGGAYLAMCGKPLGCDAAFAWPTAEIAVMGPDGAANIIYRKEIESAEDPIAMRKQMVEKYRDEVSNPFIACARGYVEDILDPRETRSRLIATLDALATKRENRPRKKNGNIPV